MIYGAAYYHYDHVITPCGIRNNVKSFHYNITSIHSRVLVWYHTKYLINYTRKEANTVLNTMIMARKENASKSKIVVRSSFVSFSFFIIIIFSLHPRQFLKHIFGDECQTIPIMNTNRY